MSSSMSSIRSTLSSDEDDVLWEVLGIEEVFFESPETWKAAMEVLKRDIEASASNKSPETCPS